MLMMKKLNLILLSISFLAANSFAQKKEATKPAEPTNPLLKAETYSSLSFRSIGPAVTSGRIVDIAINPKNKYEWYIVAGASGVWKSGRTQTSELRYASGGA